MKATHFFNTSEKDAVEAVIRETESRTIGEVAVMVVDASSRYREAEVLGGITLGNVIALVCTVSFFQESLWWFVPLTVLFFFPCWFLFSRMPALKIHFTGPARRGTAVRRRTLQAFYEKGLHRTAQNTGVLFFISLLERRVWVLADRGIYEKITQDDLNGFARIVSEGIKHGRAADALIGAIGDAGRLLQRHFPIQPGDINELPDAVIIESRPADD